MSWQIQKKEVHWSRKSRIKRYDSYFSASVTSNISVGAVREETRDKIKSAILCVRDKNPERNKTGLSDCLTGTKDIFLKNICAEMCWKIRNNCSVCTFFLKDMFYFIIGTVYIQLYTA